LQQRFPRGKILETLSPAKSCIRITIKYFPEMPELPISNLISRATTAEVLATEIASCSGLDVRIADVWQLLGYCSAEPAREAVADPRLRIEVGRLSGPAGRIVRPRALTILHYKVVPVHSLSSDQESLNSVIQEEADAHVA